MKKRMIRAVLILLSLVMFLFAACLVPSADTTADDTEAADFKAEVISADSGTAQGELKTGSLPEMLSGETIGQNPFWSSLLTGLRRVLYFGGSQYVKDKNNVTIGFNDIVGDMYDVTRGLGYCIMIVCWIIGMCKSGISLDFNPGAKNGIIRSGLSLLLCLFLMESSMQIMEILSTMCWAYCAELYEHGDMANSLNALLSSVENADIIDEVWIFLKERAVDVMGWIIEAVLLLNVAYMGLLQCFSPVFVGFAAGGEGTRRFATSFFKEYLRVCLVPPVVVVYSALCFNLFLGSSVSWFLCIILGLSVFGIKNKLDKLIA